MAQITCIVVTPESTALETQADFIALPLYDGELGVAPGHSPMIGRLGFGEMRINNAGTSERYYLDGGFVQIAANVVTVLTGRAVVAKQLSSENARKQLETAMSRPANTDELAQVRDRLISQARAQIRVAQRG